MQTVKSFVQGRTSDGKIELTSIDDQIDQFLQENPNYIAKSITAVDHMSNTEVYVLFDIREQRDPKPERPPEKKAEQKHGK